MTDKITRRTTLRAIAGLTTAAVAPRAFVGAAYAQENLKGTGEVVVHDGGGAWGEAQKAAFFDPFEAATGIKVVPAAQMPTGAVRASVLAGAPAYDVVDLPGGQVDSFVAEDLLEKIDYSFFRAGDKEDISPIAPTDYMLPSLFYSLVLAYDQEAFANGAPETWADAWNVEKFPGKRTFFNAGDDALAGAVFETAMMADGVEPNAVYPIDFDRVFKSLDKIKPEILRFWSAGAEPAQLLTDGSVSVASAWNGRISALQAQNIPVGLSWKQAVLQWDAWTVLKGSKNRENAMKFLAFVAQPEPQAKFAEMIEYGVTNTKAYALMKPERAAILPGNPESVSSQLVQNYSFWNEIDADGKTNIQKANELWQQWVTK
jgi:putative spermidine/putrescine transport system substrate-binding protein